MERERPRGVTLLGVYYAVLGVGIVALAVYGVYVIRTIPEALRSFQAQPEALVGIAVLVAAVHILTTFGLWTLRPWARLLVMALSGLGIAFGMITLPLGFAAVMLNLATIWYITSHPVRRAFATPSARRSSNG